MNKVYGILLILVAGVCADKLDMQIESKESIEQVRKSIAFVKNSKQGKNIYDVLQKYENDKVTLVTLWFDIALQIEEDRGIAFFIKKSIIGIKAILATLVFDEDQPLQEKDRALLFEKINFLKLRADQVDVKQMSEKYDVKGDLFLRTMPIVSDLTKKRNADKRFVVIKKGTIVKLRYQASYKQSDDQKVTHWGYVYAPELGDEGWINLKYLYMEDKKGSDD